MDEDQISPQELAIRWNAPLRVVYALALGKHEYSHLTGKLNFYSQGKRVYFSLKEVMNWEKKLAKAKIPLSWLVEKLK